MKHLDSDTSGTSDQTVSTDTLSFGIEAEENAGKERQFITSLARGLEILRSFRPGDRLLGNRDIARRTGLPKPTVSRLTYTLTRLGYLTYSETLGKYQLGTAVLSLGYSFLANFDILPIASPLMQELADYSHTAVAVGARDRLGMLYLHGCYSADATVSLRMESGMSIPIATTAMGRALLCGLPEGEREVLMDHIRRENIADWPRNRAGIEQALREYQEKGFCLSLGAWRKDVNAVAVPMLSVNGSQVLTFNCASLSFVLSREMLEDDIGPRLVNMVRIIENNAARH